MELIRDKWTYEDGREFVRYLESLKRVEKISWTKNIINTNMEVLAIKADELVKISKEIKKGNYFSFLDLGVKDYYENTVINGNLIAGIKDFDVMKSYLNEYSKVVDNWASCDLLKFNVKGREELFFSLSNEYVKSEYTFSRRIGIIILFKLIDNDLFIDRIFKMLNGFYDENEYYVNMVNAWLICELFIKRRDRTLEFFKDNNLNKFTINKAISKCRDSFRVRDEDKELLLSFRR